MDNPINWSFKVGSVFGITIRVHLLFLLGGLVVVFHNLSDGGGWQGLGYGLGSLGLLFGIVLLHEFGHCFGARYAGGQADEILMWPLGGLAYTNPPHNPRAHLITVAAGPAVNVMFLLVTGAFLVLWTGTFGSLPLNPFNPFHTRLTLIPGSPHYWLVVFFTFNLIILLFNLAPVFPFDGGRVLQCLLWPKKGFVPATMIATGIGMVGAIVFGVMGIVTEQALFFAIAFFGYFTCWQQRQAIKSGMYDSGNEFGDFSQGYTSLNKDDASEPKPSFWQRRRAQKDAVRDAREAQLQEEHRREVDRILEKVHESGVASLTDRERHLLEKETERQRTDN